MEGQRKSKQSRKKTKRSHSKLLIEITSDSEGIFYFLSFIFWSYFVKDINHNQNTSSLYNLSNIKHTNASVYSHVLGSSFYEIVLKDGDVKWIPGRDLLDGVIESYWDGLKKEFGDDGVWWANKTKVHITQFLEDNM